MGVFYDIEKSSRLSLVREAAEKAYKTSTYKLECSISARRQLIDKTIHEILDITTRANFNHFVFVMRDGFQEDDYIEVAVRTEEAGIDYFIIIEMNKDNLDHFIDKYNLAQAKRGE